MAVAGDVGGELSAAGAFGFELGFGAFGSCAFGAGEGVPGFELGVVAVAEGFAFAGGVVADSACFVAGVGFGLAGAGESSRGVARDAALAAIPARKGRRAGQSVQPREISHARTRRAVIAAIRTGRTSYKTLTSAIGKYRTVIDRNRHRTRKSKSPGSFGHASLKDTITRTAEALITIASNPA